MVNVHRSHPRYSYRSVVKQRHYGEGVHRWRHDPRHRRGVDYHSSRVRSDYGRSSATGRFQSERVAERPSRGDLRGRIENSGSSVTGGEYSGRRAERAGDSTVARSERIGERATESGRLRGSGRSATVSREAVRPTATAGSGDTTARRGSSIATRGETTINRATTRRVENRTVARTPQSSINAQVTASQRNREAAMAERQRSRWSNTSTNTSAATRVTHTESVTPDTRATPSNNRWGNRSSARSAPQQSRANAAGEAQRESRRAAQ